MKKIIQLIFTAAIMFGFKHVKGQTTELARYKEVTEKIASLYNKEDYKGIYQLLSPAFKKQLSEKEITGFFKGNLRPNYGLMKEAVLTKDKPGVKFYKVDFENGVLELMLVCNAGFLIDGFSFTPPKEEPTQKKAYKSDNKKQSELDLEVERAVEGYMSNPKTAGLSLAVIKNGVTVFYQYGETKKESQQLPSLNTLYETGSVSKTFTGLLLAKAMEDKKLSLDDDVRKYLPASCSKLEYNKQPITIKHLVNHTSGIPRITDDMEKQPDYDPLNPYKNYSKQMVFDYLGRLKLQSLPGTIQEYSNTGMALLGIILEKVYEENYGELVKQYIAGPFGMNHTFVNVPDSLQPSFATGYDMDGTETPHWDLGDLAGAGGIKSTIADMAVYMKEQLKEEKQFVKLSHQTTWQKDQSGTALAWFTQQTKTGNTLVWHNGGTYGFVSFCGYVKEKQCAVVVLCNTSLEGKADEIGIQILKYLQK